MRSVRSSSGQGVVVAVLEDEAEHARLGVVEIEHASEQERPERMDRRPELRSELAAQRQELDRVAHRREVEPQVGHALLDLRVRRVAGQGHPADVALDVGDQAGHAGERQLAGDELEGLRLARARRAGDEAVTAEHRQGDVDPDVRIHRGPVERTAQDDARLVELVARGERLLERTGHGHSSQSRATATDGRRQAQAPDESSGLALEFGRRTGRAQRDSFTAGSAAKGTT